MREIKLTDEELLFLDGKVGPDAQKIVEQAKQALEHAILGPFGAEVIRLALEQGMFKWNHTSLTYCSLCKTSAGYAPYKSGYNRGLPNYKKPRYMGGVEFMRGFVSIKGFAANGGCVQCVGDLAQRIQEYILDKDLPIQLPDHEKTKWVKEDFRRCTKCDTVCGDFDCYLDRTLMGDGWYYCACPNCKAKGGFLSNLWKYGEGHRMVLAVDVVRVKNCYSRRAENDRTIWEMKK